MSGGVHHVKTGDGPGGVPGGPGVVMVEPSGPCEPWRTVFRADTPDGFGSRSVCRPQWTPGPKGAHGGAMLTAQQLADLERVMAEDDRTAPEPTDEQLSRLSELLWPYVPRAEAS